MTSLARELAVVAVFAFAVSRCGSGASSSPAIQSSTVPGHEHHAPHGGTLVELGDEFAHIELVFDRSDGRLTAFILDGEAERPIRLPEHEIAIVAEGIPEFASKPLDLVAVADVLTGETVGSTSQFTLVLPAFKKMAHLEGRILSLTVRGQHFQNLRFEVGEPRPAWSTRPETAAKRQVALSSGPFIESRCSSGHRESYRQSEGVTS